MLYTYDVRKRKIVEYQETVLKALSGKIDNFYLAGGTALSLFYFQHRLSVDLDFFMPHFSAFEVRRIMEFLCKALKVEAKLVGQALKKETAKIMVYNMYFTNANVLKIDFVEDTAKLIKKYKIVDGINILSLEDIYIRKIFALIGFVRVFDKVGRLKLAGGRSDAKDFYDVYCLSHTFMPLSKFISKYYDATMKEGLIRWFQTFDRMKMMDGILELNISKKVNYKNLEKHFKKEIDKIIEHELGDI